MALRIESLRATAAELFTFNRTLHASLLPFMALPSALFQFDEIKSFAASLRGKGVSNIVVLGIGGSGSRENYDIFLTCLLPLSIFTLLILRPWMPTTVKRWFP